MVGAANAGEAGSCEASGAPLSDRGKSSKIGPVRGGRGLGGGLEACEGDGSVVGGGRKTAEACEGGEEEVGDAEVCIAACKSLASRRLVADVSEDQQTTWSPHRESISPERCVSASLLVF